MAKSTFQLSYDGPALRDGTMDVNELAFSLMAVGDLIRNANEQVNSGRAVVSVRVRSDFKKGSFDVAMLLDQSLIQHAANVLFPSVAALGGLTILKLLFGSEIEKIGIISSVLEMWKKVKGEKPKEIVKDEAKGVTIIVMGNGNRLNVDPVIADLYNKDELRSSLAGLVRPLVSPGIESLTLRKGNKQINRVDKSDLPPLDSDETAGMEIGSVQSSTREAVLRVSRANFEKGKWGFYDGAAHFSADIADEAFLSRLDARDEGFFKGDTLRAIVTVSQEANIDGSKLHTTYVIEKVLGHTHAPRQQNLIP